MGNVNAVLYFFEEGEEAEDGEINLRANRRNLRDTTNPFEIPEREFIRIFRLDRYSARELIDRLIPLMPPADGPLAIPNHLRVNIS